MESIMQSLILNLTFKRLKSLYINSSFPLDLLLFLEILSLVEELSFHFL